MSLKINVNNKNKVEETGISIDPFKITTNKTGNKFSFNVYIPTIVTESIYRSNLTDLLTNYNEKVVAVYSFKKTEISSSLKWSLYFGVGVAAIIAGLVLYNSYSKADKDKTDKDKTNTKNIYQIYFNKNKRNNGNANNNSNTNDNNANNSFLLEYGNQDRNTFTKLDMNESNEMNIISVIVDIIHDIDILNETDPKVYKSKANKVTNLINYSIAKPSVICFLDEFQDIYSKNKDILDKYNFVTFSSLDDRVTCIISISKEIFYSTTSLSRIKKDLNIDEVQLSNIDKISREYKTKVV